MASSDPPYEAIMQQITYLMPMITNWNANNNGQNGSRHNNRNGKFSNTKTQRPKKERNDMTCLGCGVLDIGGKSVQHPNKVIISLSNWPIKI